MARGDFSMIKDLEVTNYSNNGSVEVTATILTDDPKTIDNLSKAVKNGIQITVDEKVGDVIKKCAYCGQYGAKFCACIKCGAPID